MKLKKLVLATLTAGALIGGSLQANAQLDFHVDPGQSWLGYVNYVDGGGVIYGGAPEATGDLVAGFTGATLNLSPNTSLLGNGAAEVEANMYQEVVGTIGDTVTFSFDTVFDDLPAGYEARGFIKVLDGFASWATTQYEWVPLVAGQGGSLSFVVADAGAGSEVVQAGFSLQGPSLAGGDPGLLTMVSVVPEPTTFALAGLGAAALLIFRRRS